MGSTTLLSLPTELLDRVYSHLDWDRSRSLYLERPDIVNISLTCVQLRQSVLPLLFRHVILKLRWVDGALIEPTLFRLRRYEPQLARHVRSVLIQTEFGQYVDPDFVIPGFAVPEALSDWVNPASIPDDPTRAVEICHRQSVMEVARSLFEKCEHADLSGPYGEELKKRVTNFSYHIFGKQNSLDSSSSTATPDDESRLLGPIGQSRSAGWTNASRTSLDESRYLDSVHGADLLPADSESRTSRSECIRLKLELDALVVVMLLLPATVTSVSFEAHPRGRLDLLRHAFALNVAARAIDVFGERLQHFSLITSPPQTPRYMRAGREYSELDRESNILTNDVLNRMRKLKTLVISDQQSGGNHRLRGLTTEGQTQWHTLAHTLSTLELWNFEIDSRELLRFVQGFDQLEKVAFENVALNDTQRNLMLPGAHRREISRTVWLMFLIQLRREMPTVAIRLGRLKEHGKITPLSPSVVNWLTTEAIPTNSLVTYDRETRLVEDFGYFLDLWIADDGVRGEQAREARKDGRLVDAAMTSRWKTFANQR